MNLTVLINHFVSLAPRRAGINVPVKAAAYSRNMSDSGATVRFVTSGRVFPLLRFGLVILLCVAAAAVTAMAQVSVSGIISGTVVDTSESVVPQAKITITNEGTGAERQAVTDGNGNFVVAGFGPGNYSVKVSMSGFATTTRTGLVLTANERLTIGNIQLSLGTATSTVTVSAEAVTVNTETAEVSAEMSTEKLSELMVKGRDFMNVVRILPGVATAGGGDVAGGTFGTASPTIGGLPQNYNNLSLDGASASDTDIRGSFSAGIAVDAIGEIKVLSSTYLPEIGPNPGGSIKLVTKSGTKDYHGTVYYYKRHKEFNAADFFVNRNGLVNPPYRLTTVGWTWGGPAFLPKIISRQRSKMFFFYNTEITRSVLPNANLQSTTPTALERSGDFSKSLAVSGALETIKDPSTNVPFSGNQIPASRINLQGQKLLSVFPLPNVLTPGAIALAAGQYNYQFYNGQDVPKNSHTLRLDYQLTPNDTLTFRPKMWRSDSKTYTGVFSFNSNVPLVYYDYYYSHDDLFLSETHIFNPTLVNDVSVSYTVGKERGNERQGRVFTAVERPTYGITLSQFHPEVNPYNFIPSMSFGSPIPNSVTFSTDQRAPIFCGDEVFEFSDNLTKTLRGHTFKFGVYSTRTWSSEGLRAPNFNGNFSFSNDSNNTVGNTGQPYATALLGNFTSYSEPNTKNLALGFDVVNEFYAQDQWKVSKRLTISYGARFSYFGTYRLRDGQHGSAFSLSAYNPANTPRQYVPGCVTTSPCSGVNRIAVDPLTGAKGPAVLISGFVPGTGNLANGVITDADINAGKYPAGWVDHYPLQISPRFGFAFDLFGNGKTALRGGFGDGKHVIGNSGVLNNIGFSQPVVAVSTQYYGNFNTMFSNPGTVFPSAMTSFDRDPVVPSIYNWSFGIEQALPWKTRLDISYVGNASRHVETTQQLEAYPAGTQFLPQNQDTTLTSGAKLNAFLFPYREYSSLSYLTNNGTTDYHSLQVKVDRQIAKSMQIGLAYTWSKAMTKTGASNPYVADEVWVAGLANFDQTQIFVANYQWHLPGLSKLLPNAFVKAAFDGWQLSGISTFATGTPGSVGASSSVGLNYSGSSIAARAVVIGDPNAGPRTFSQWFNAAAYAAPAQGTFGNAAPLTYRGPGFNNWDLTMAKDFRIGSEKRTLQIKAEAYNAFNHTQFNGVNTSTQFNAAGVQTNAQLGQITSTRAPRVMQLAADFRF